MKLDAGRIFVLLTVTLAAVLCSDGPAASARATYADHGRTLILGYSAQGRPIEATIFGDGPRKLVVVGNTHGAPEANTYRLTLELIEYFRANPDQVPSAVRLAFIPTINPDGLVLGWRFDAAMVDLNRNMNTALDDCPENDWRATVHGAYGIISTTGGPYPDSQVEVRLLRAFLWDAAGAIFLHSSAGLVFPPSCEHAPSIALAQRYAEGAGYHYSRFWSAYPITGGMHDWAGGLGIAAIVPELLTGDQSEFAQNLAGLLAVLADAETLLPEPEDGVIGRWSVPASIWRYWRALGGEERFGPPLEAARATPQGMAQTFRNARIAVYEDRRDTAAYVQLEPLGAEAARDLAYGGAQAPDDTIKGRFFAETGHWISGAFLDFWERGGGVEVFGLPLSASFEGLAADGRRRRLQYFERAVLAFYPEDGRVRLEPLGMRELALEDLTQPTTPFTVR